MNILRFMIPKSLVSYVEDDSTVRQALEKMRFHRYAAIPVLDKEGRYVGTLRNDDLLNYFLESGSFDTKEAEGDQVSLLLSGSYTAVHHDATVNEIIERVKEHNFVPVVDDRECFIGIRLRRDILNFLLEYYEGKREGRKESNCQGGQINV